jgi:plastocyanin
MKRTFTILIACVTLLLVSGCGSSKNTTSSSTGASGTTGAGAGSTSSSPGGAEVFGEPSEKPTTPRPSGQVAEIAYRDVAISPAKTRVKVDTTIVWTNHDSVEHNVTSVSGPSHFASKNIEEGQTFQFKATRAGTIRYECTIHPTSMKGTIEVIK